MDNDISPEGYSSPMANFLPTKPSTQQQASSREREETLSQLPLLKKVLTRFEKRMADTDSNKVTRILAEKYNLSADNAMALQEIIHDILETERRFIEGRIDRTKP